MGKIKERGQWDINTPVGGDLIAAPCDDDLRRWWCCLVVPMVVPVVVVVAVERWCC